MKTRMNLRNSAKGRGINATCKILTPSKRAAGGKTTPTRRAQISRRTISSIGSTPTKRTVVKHATNTVRTSRRPAAVVIKIQNVAKRQFYGTRSNGLSLRSKTVCRSMA